MSELRGARIILRDKQYSDAENDYRWRSDPELARLDAAIPLTMSFERYLKLFEDQLKYPTPGSHHYSIDTLDHRFIGNCMYYDIDAEKSQCELGIMIGNRNYWSKGYGTDVVKTAVTHIFQMTELERVYLHTLTNNYRAQKSFRKAGFIPICEKQRDGYEFVFMEIRRAIWEADKAKSAIELSSRTTTK